MGAEKRSGFLAYTYGLQVHIQEYLVLVILVNPQIPFCDPEGGMVKNIHQDNRRHACFPGMVAKSLTQAVAAELHLKFQIMACIFQYAEGLLAA